MASKDTQNTQPYLTRRQKECLCMTADGMTAQAIALKIGISMRMVRWHLKGAREKLDAVSTVQAVHLADKAGLLD